MHHDERRIDKIWQATNYFFVRKCQLGSPGHILIDIAIEMPMSFVIYKDWQHIIARGIEHRQCLCGTRL